MIGDVLTRSTPEGSADYEILNSQHFLGLPLTSQDFILHLRRSQKVLDQIKFQKINKFKNFLEFQDCLPPMRQNRQQLVLDFHDTQYGKPIANRCTPIMLWSFIGFHMISYDFSRILLQFKMIFLRFYYDIRTAQDFLGLPRTSQDFLGLGVMEIKHQLLPVLLHRRQTVLEF